MIDVAAEQDIVDTLVIDSQGDYSPTGPERVWRAPQRLTWLQASNYGLANGFTDGYDIVVLLNNDTRLSPAFFRGIRAAMADGAGLCGPVYDDVWATQRTPYTGPAATYVAQARERIVPFIDGTCLGVSRLAFTQLGGLNEERFGRHGWAADFDYSLRARAAGFAVIATLRSYLNHVGQVTAGARERGYAIAAVEEATAGMTALYGKDWPTLLGVPDMVCGVYGRVISGHGRAGWGSGTHHRRS